MVQEKLSRKEVCARQASARNKAEESREGKKVARTVKESDLTGEN